MTYTAHTPSDELSDREELQVRELARVVEALVRVELARRLAVHPRYAAV